MGEEKTYTGGCHCGQVQFDVQMDLGHATACNCSICSKMGWLLAFVPKEKFNLRSGQDVLTDYQFGKKTIHHLFCSRCGINSFSRGKSPKGGEMIAVNTRCLDGVDPSTLTVNRFDGKSL
jgi:hypothetical protein